MLDGQQLDKITKLVESISAQLEKGGQKPFSEKPTAYVFVMKEKYLVSLVDEGKKTVQVNIAKGKPKRGIINFFMSIFVVNDFLSTEENNIAEFARDKVAGYLEELREDVAYSTNLKRVRALKKSGQYLAAVVFLISAFETAMKDIFFRSNELWFFVIENSTNEALCDKFGTRLDKKATSKFQVTLHLGDKTWGFTREGSERLETWENIERKTSVFKICKQLGVLDEYLLRLYSNQLLEVGSYEMLKQTLESQSTRSLINFQMIEGTGGIRWSFGKFLAIDFKEVEKDLQIIKEAAAKRHKIIHGFLDEKQITIDYVKEVEEAVSRVIEYVKNEVLEWSYVTS